MIMEKLIGKGLQRWNNFKLGEGKLEMYEQLKKILLDCGVDEGKVDSTDFIREDILDSLTMAEIIIAVEDLYSIEIDPEEIIPDNFVNIQTICDLVVKYIKN